VPAPLRLLAPELAGAEPAWKRWVYLGVALLIVGGFAYVVLSFWAPAHPAVDQNGYLVGGKMLARTGSPGIRPPDGYAYVGGMWVRTGDGWYYPKYPIGLPLLNAVALWLDPREGDPQGKVWAMLVSPACTALALMAMFLLARLVAGSFAAVLATILLATSLTTLAVANNPWSHGPALCFVTWGAYLLVRWWQTGSIWRGILAGLLLGYAVTIRYTEGLLVLPLALVVVLTIRWRTPRTYLRAATPALAWLVPVAALVAFNRIAMGTWTGYDTTNESTGFAWQHFTGKWEFMAQQLYDYGLFFVAPLGVLGLLAMYRASWRVALLLTLWFVPGVLLYTAYYWGMQRGGIGYLRFFLTLFPPMILAAVWCMRQVSLPRLYHLTPGHDRGLSSKCGGSDGAVAAPLACGVVVAIASAVGVKNVLPVLAREHAANWNLAYTTEQLVRAAPRGAVLFVQPGERGTSNLVHQAMNFFQFGGDYDLYALDAFAERGPGSRLPGRDGAAPVDPDAPSPMQPARRKYLAEQVYHGKTDADHVAAQQRITRDALASGRRAFVLMRAGPTRSFEQRFLRDTGMRVRRVAAWKDPAPVPPDPPPTALQPFARGGPGPAPAPAPAAGPPPPRPSLAWQLLEITPASAPQPAKTQSAPN
jgi:hypothetical protein